MIVPKSCFFIFLLLWLLTEKGLDFRSLGNHLHIKSNDSSNKKES